MLGVWESLPTFLFFNIRWQHHFHCCCIALVEPRQLGFLLRTYRCTGWLIIMYTAAHTGWMNDTKYEMHTSTNIHLSCFASIVHLVCAAICCRVSSESDGINLGSHLHCIYIIFATWWAAFLDFFYYKALWFWFHLPQVAFERVAVIHTWIYKMWSALL